jgi:hypothetical protein
MTERPDPCPFCGSVHVSVDYCEGYSSRVVCNNCHVAMYAWVAKDGGKEPTFKTAVDKWNRRAQFCRIAEYQKRETP